ncbi:hypothetical protein [Streptomyces sp. NRRL S-118]|uniref:hypothetical protein n=1 Tax=Streptomyces sp. NRRL S-118 TaxID=1463881 RepID=UPI000ADF2596|nr:hypothetical protein [Streptomyces sp. NRRL S-118]
MSSSQYPDAEAHTTRAIELLEEWGVRPTASMVELAETIATIRIAEEHAAGGTK